jgi:hypothetical protein
MGAVETTNLVSLACAHNLVLSQRDWCFASIPGTIHRDGYADYHENQAHSYETVAASSRTHRRFIGVCSYRLNCGMGGRRQSDCTAARSSVATNHDVPPISFQKDTFNQEEKEQS